MLRSILTAASCTLFVTVAFSTYVPLRAANGIEYLFVWPGGGRLLLAAAVGVGIVALLYGVTIAIARRRAPDAVSEARAGKWLSPLSVVGVVAVGLLPAVPGVGERAAAAGYFFYDLRWCWLALGVLVAAVRLDRLFGDPIARRVRAIESWSPAARRLLLDGVLFFGVIGWAWATTPSLRANTSVSGDEPKYLRYCEVWYQGQGFQIDTKKYLSELPLDGTSAVLGNFAWLPATIAQEAGAMVDDVRRAAANPIGFRWNRAKGADGFLTGKRGGVYQIHQPGLSFILFPGYVLDRGLLSLRPGYDAEIPADLMMMRLTLLMVYGAAAVALFRLLANALESDWIGWIWAALGMLMLPMTAFAMQFYPELPTALVILIVANVVLFHARRIGAAAGALSGAGAAFLCWFHPRFVLVSLCLAVAGTIGTSGVVRRAFLAGFALVMFSLTAYDYHVTGSWLPNALYSSQQDGLVAFAESRVALNLAGYAVNRMWGLAPHAIILMGAVPGLFVLARRSWTHAAFVVAIVVALAIPAAGHTLNAAGTTPGRLVLAVIPLLVWPVAVLVRQFWSSTIVRVLTVLAGALTLDTALAYNRTFGGGVESLRDTSVSGWKVNLAFPHVRDNATQDSSPASLALVSVLVAVTLVVSVLAFVRSARARRADRARPRRAWLVSAGTVVSFLALASVATSAMGGWTRDEYLMDPAAAYRAAREALLAQERCRLCFTSGRRQVDWTWLQPNPVKDLRIALDFDERTVIAHLNLESAGAFGRVRVDFGDGAGTPWQRMVEPLTLKHTYAHGGKFRLDAWLQLPTGEPRATRVLVYLD